MTVSQRDRRHVRIIADPLVDVPPSRQQELRPCYLENAISEDGRATVRAEGGMMHDFQSVSSCPRCQMTGFHFLGDRVNTDEYGLFISDGAWVMGNVDVEAVRRHCQYCSAVWEEKLWTR